MKIDTKNLQPLVKAKKPRDPAKPSAPSKSEFTLACEAAGKNPGTIRRRMQPRHEGGQGMTLEEALAAPVKNRRECGAKARAANRHWGLTGETV